MATRAGLKKRHLPRYDALRYVIEQRQAQKVMMSSNRHSPRCVFFVHSMTLRFPFLALTLSLAFAALGQNEHFEWLGVDVMPLPTDSIDPVPYSGELNNFSGGYAEGDTVGDFHLWTLNGDDVILSNFIDPDKPTIIFNGSATCVRFQNDWDIVEPNNIVAWVTNHLDDFNWIPVYVAEAHALDLENCPSNCPAFPIPGPSGEYLNQHRIVQDRLDAAQTVIDFMGPGSDNGWAFPWDDILIDTPNNIIYENFFLRPAGMVVVNCDGIVIERANWLGLFLSDIANQMALETLIQEPVNSETNCLLSSNAEDICEEGSPDTDGDGTCDALEIEMGTDPFNPCDMGTEGLEDSDEDGACDAMELLSGTDPNNPCDPFNLDTDNDGYCDVEEVLLGSNPNNPCSPATVDTDGDGYCDSEELDMGSDVNDPCSPDVLDSDMDGICNSSELANGTDPNNTCDPLGVDTDGDGLCDQLETVIGSSVNDPCSPYSEDSDGDGYCDQLESIESWDATDACIPNDVDLDGDGWCGGMELASGWSDDDPCLPINTDSDGDGLCDMEELLLGHDPLDPCSPAILDTDGDGLCDMYEIIHGSSPFAAESVLSVGTLGDNGLMIVPNADGFNVTCDGCIGKSWSLLDASGRTLQSGTLASWNAWNAPVGVYVLSLPALGFHSRVVVQN